VSPLWDSQGAPVDVLTCRIVGEDPGDGGAEPLARVLQAPPVLFQFPQREREG
jgi:hypothetical protein